MLKFGTLCLLIFVPLLRAEQRCQPTGPGGTRMYNGKMCASTTRYDDGFRGSCGCGPPGTNTPFDWNLRDLVVAPSEMYFADGRRSTWCGANCCKCVRLTPTGGYVPGEGAPPRNKDPKIFLVANACPINGFEKWCGIWGKPGTGNKNTYGYELHFDIQNHYHQIDNMGWNNPEVTWEEVPCPSDFRNKAHQCECSQCKHI